MEREAGDITRLLVEWGHGDRAAYDRVMELVYGELKRLARRAVRRGGDPAVLQPTGFSLNIPDYHSTCVANQCQLDGPVQNGVVVNP